MPFDKKSVYTFAFIGLLVCGFIIFNYGPSEFKFAGIQYAAFILLGLAIMYLVFKSGTSNLIGVGDKVKANVLFGFGFGAGFIFLNVLSPAISIGFPTIPQALGGAFFTFFIVALTAPIVEEFFFRLAMLNYLQSNLKLKPVFAVPAQALVFAIYHVTAYQSSLASAGGAFFGAFIFGCVAGGIANYKKSIIPGTVMHSMFNAWLLEKASLSVVAVF